MESGHSFVSKSESVDPFYQAKQATPFMMKEKCAEYLWDDMDVNVHSQYNDII
jgi:hypothetical protein